MLQLTNKHILLGITGGIAAYKAAELSRRLKEAGAEVRVAMTAAACEFITPLTLQALTGNPVHTDLLDANAEAGMGHIELARWADAVVVAPASANFIGRVASGQADDLLTTLLVATRAAVAIAPAMNQQMWQAEATQTNLQTLRDRHYHIFGPAAGEQACGEVGLGRMLEPEQLRDLTASLFSNGHLSGNTVVVTAGPTREAIDPVRYISNHSSGKMGYAIAAAAVEAGARTVLISGPTQLAAPERVNRITVESAQTMLEATLAQLDNCDVFIATAAVADYRLNNSNHCKIKKTRDTLVLELHRTPDILATVARHKQRPPYVVGFAAETDNVVGYARDKLTHKNLDMIVANEVAAPGTGFNSDDNHVHIITASNQTDIAASKRQIARDLVAIIGRSLNQHRG